MGVTVRDIMTTRVAADLMTGPAITIRPDAPVEEAARLMYDRRVKRLPVISSAGHLIGIVSRVDVLSVFDRPDEEIRGELLRRVLPDVLDAARHGLEVTVSDGIVTLTGSLDNGRRARAVVEAVRHVQGVVAVRDRLSYPEHGSR